MHHKASLFLIFFSAVPALNRVRPHQLASLVSKCSQLFQLPKHRFKLR